MNCYILGFTSLDLVTARSIFPSLFYFFSRARFLGLVEATHRSPGSKLKRNFLDWGCMVFTAFPSPIFRANSFLVVASQSLSFTSNRKRRRNNYRQVDDCHFPRLKASRIIWGTSLLYDEIVANTEGCCKGEKYAFRVHTFCIHTTQAEPLSEFSPLTRVPIIRL